MEPATSDPVTKKEVQDVLELNGLPALPSALRREIAGAVANGYRAISIVRRIFQGTTRILL
jgi:hypothetical protein